MAFLDNSGDIILDAVLTETGRRKMAEGNFKIVKFALGDDEIDYSLYNLNHPSGTAYADLEILQTPIMESATQVGLNSSLMTIANNDILYMPSLLLNEKLDTAVKRQNNTIYIAVNSQTKASLDNSSVGFGSGYALLAGQRGGASFITIESCMDNSDIPMTRANQSTYIVSKNMLDTNMKVTFDNNFITFPMVSSGKTSFSTGTDGSWTGTTGPLQSLTSVSPAARTGYSTAIGPMSRANIFTPAEGTTDVTTFIQSAGVVGSMAYLNVSIDPALTTTKDQTASTKWTKFGNTGVTITGLSATRTYSTIALELEITTNSSAATISIPITLIKRDT